MKYDVILITGGAGFIGSNFIHFLFNEKKYQGTIINVDKLTYAGNRENLIEINNKFGGKRYFFEKIDIANYNELLNVFKKYNPDCIINFAAESHVDRSIVGPKDFIYTNIIGTFNLLEIAKKFWEDKKGKRFHHISTDEVYGSLGENGYFYETSPYNPRSPYSASKASSDHLVKAYYYTYGLPATISNCSNNYGPYQFPEKLIPLIINNILEEKALPIYGDGKNVRDWLYVKDHCNAIYQILENGKVGETYNIGGENELTNIELVNILCEKMAEKMNKSNDYYKKLIKFVKDRAGHDRRYAINCDKIKTELGWKQEVDFETGIEFTINWYLKNTKWLERVKSGEYRKWIMDYYENN